MKKESLLDKIRIQIEQVENYGIFFMVIMFVIISIGLATLYGMFVYTKR